MSSKTSGTFVTIDNVKYFDRHFDSETTPMAKVEDENTFKRCHQTRNEKVRLDHLELKKGDGVERTPLLVLPGQMQSKETFKELFDQEDILDKRDCYLLDLRNGEFSDWHDECSYELMAADIIRWADKNGVKRFDLFGH